MEYGFQWIEGRLGHGGYLLLLCRSGCLLSKILLQSNGVSEIALQNDPNNADALMYMGMCFKMADKEDLAQVS